MKHYNTLGVEPSSTPEQIKAAYKKKAMKHHPDKGGDLATFQEIQKAYDVLSDPARKKLYDETGDDNEIPDRNLLDLQILANLIAQIMEHIDPETFNLVDEIHKGLNNEIDKFTQYSIQFNSKIRKLQTAIDRLSLAESKRNIVAEILEGQIAKVKQDLAEIESSKETLTRIKTLLNGYTYKADQRPHRVNVGQMDNNFIQDMIRQQFHGRGSPYGF